MNKKIKKNLENNLILAFAGMVANIDTDAISLGKMLEDSGADTLTDGGFWVWAIDTNIEYYSTNFKKVLGFENEIDFPNVPKSWQKQIKPSDLDIAMDNYAKSKKDSKKHPYYQEVSYTTKQGKEIRLICSGVIIVVNKKNKFLIGTHKLL